MNRKLLARFGAVAAVCLLPFFNFLAANADGLVGSFWAMRYIFLIVAGLVALGVAILLLAERRGEGGAFSVWWIVGILAFFHYALVPDPARSALSNAGLSWVPNPLFLILGLLAAGLLYRFARHAAVQNAAVLFALFMAAVGGVNGAKAWILALHSDPATSLPATVPFVKGRPNIHYVVLDGYAGVTGMRDTVKFDNSGFLRAMYAAGFHDAGAVPSNYVNTAQALGAVFAMDYVASLSNPRTLFPAILDGAPPLATRLKELGYDLWQTESLYYGCRGALLTCLSRQQGRLTTVYVTQSFLVTSFVGRLTALVMRKPEVAFNTVLNSQGRLLAGGRPFFIFMHQLYPHPPYRQDARCRPRIPDDAAWNGWDPQGIPHYVEVVQCLNSSVRSFVSRVVNADPGAIIVIQSDHGSGFRLAWDHFEEKWSPEAVAERTSFLNLVRAPSACRPWLRRGLGQINTMRFALGCAQGRAPDYLPERTILEMP